MSYPLHTLSHLPQAATILVGGWPNLAVCIVSNMPYVSEHILLSCAQDTQCPECSPHSANVNSFKAAYQTDSCVVAIKLMLTRLVGCNTHRKLTKYGLAVKI